MSSAVVAAGDEQDRPLQGIALYTLVIVLSLANFLAYLDTTIANVLVGNIAGSLATSPSNGTWVITGYAVAEAIMVPLTGWLVERFGAVRTFIVCIIGFGVCSILCGMATSLSMLILFRVLLGLFGGPMIPISQTLLLKIVPESEQSLSLTIWSMGSLMAPIVGPVIGGIIGDNYYWGWAFYFKAPLAFGIAALAWFVLRKYETKTVQARVDFGGLFLLVVWIGALQIMLGNGQDKDWFNAPMIFNLLIVTAVGFISFVIWELTDRGPVVDLRIYRDRAFSVSMIVVFVAFGCMFGSIVLLPMWLQNAMGYTATWSGLNSAMSGITMVAAAPLVGMLTKRFDIRAVIFTGLLLTAASCGMRVFYNDQITFWQLMWPQLIFGVGMVMTMVPLIELSTASLADKDIANGAGQFNFLRSLSSAVATAVVVAIWSNNTKIDKAQLVGAMHDTSMLMYAAQALGIDKEAIRNGLDLVTQGQAVMQATNNTFLLLALGSLGAAALVWLAPKPGKQAGKRKVMAH